MNILETGVRLALVWLLMLYLFGLYDPTVQAQLLQGQTGIRSITTNVACADISGDLNCGGKGGNATVLQLQVRLDGATEYNYDFTGLIPDATYQPGVDDDGTNQKTRQCTFSNDGSKNTATLAKCLIPRKMRLHVEVSNPILCYAKNERQLQIPSAYASGYSSAYDQKAYPVPAKSQENCAGYVAKINANSVFTSTVRPNMVYFRAFDQKMQSDVQFLSTPFAGSVHTEQDGIAANFQDCNGEVGWNGGACDYRDGWCSMCSLFTQQYITDAMLLNPNSYNNPLYFGCEFDNGFNDHCSGGICNCDVPQRRYCGQACEEKFMQRPTSNFGGRVYDGSWAQLAPMYKCYNPGGLYGVDDTSVDHVCVTQCLVDKHPPGCSPYDCVNKRRWPLMDDCTGSTRDSIRSIPGPDLMYYSQPVIIGCGSNMGVLPEIPNQKARDPSLGGCGSDPDSPNCVPSVGTDDTFTVGVCPPCTCLTGSLNMPLDFGGSNPPTVNAQAFCKADEGKNTDADPYACNVDYPLYDDDDLANDDDMHPNPPNKYKSMPYSACPITNRDRIGAISTLQHTMTGDAGTDINFFPTAEMVSLILPYCTKYDLSPEPVPFYTVTTTLYDITDGTEDPPVLSKIVLSTFDQQYDGIKTQGTSSDGGLFVQDLGINMVSGRLGPDLGQQSVVVCGAGDPEITAAKGYAAPLRYDMGGSVKSTSGDPNAYSRNYDNPWLKIQDNCTIVRHVDAEDSKSCIKNSNRVGMLPLPEILNGLWGTEEGSYWYGVGARDQHTYGTGCGQIGIDATFFGNSGNVQQACNKLRHGCIPGWIPGREWLLNQRWYDSDMQYTDSNGHKQSYTPNLSGNGGLYERYLRDEVLQARTPCQVSGQMQDDMHDATNCQEFRQSIARHRNMFPNWVPNADKPDGTCFPPNWFLQGQCMVYSDSTGASNLQGEGMLLMRIAIADVITFEATAEVAPGVFIDSDLTKECAVGQDSDQGRIIVEIQNIDATLTGSYIVTGSCDNGVTIVQNGEVDGLAAQATAQTQVRLQHSGGVIDPFQGGKTTCTLKLGTPVAANLYFDTSLVVQCGITSDISTAGGNTIRNPLDACADEGEGCQVPPPKVPPDNLNIMTIMFIVVTWFTLILLIMCACTAFNNYTASVVSLKKLERAYSSG